MERFESLGLAVPGKEHYGIFQDAALGRFTEDPVRLVHFMRAGVKDRCIDLGTGNGIIALYANALYDCRFEGIDIDKEQLALARRSAEKNGQDVPFCELDVNDAASLPYAGRYSVVTANPPYYHGGKESPDAVRRRQRHGESVEPFLAAAAKLLKNGGRLYLSYPAAETASLCSRLVSLGLEPKKAELTFSKGRAKLLLLEAVKGAAPGLVITKTEP